MTVPEGMLARTQVKGSPQEFRVFTQSENADPGAVPSTTVYRKYCLQKYLVFGRGWGPALSPPLCLGSLEPGSLCFQSSRLSPPYTLASTTEDILLGSHQFLLKDQWLVDHERAFLPSIFLISLFAAETLEGRAEVFCVTVIPPNEVFFKTGAEVETYSIQRTSRVSREQRWSPTLPDSGLMCYLYLQTATLVHFG